MLRDRWKVLVVLAAFLAAWLTCGWLESEAAPTLQHASLERIDDGDAAIAMPFWGDARLPASYRVSGTLRPGAGLPGTALHVVAQDCIRAVTVGEQTIDLSAFPQARLCDRFRGVDLAIPPVREPVPFEVVFESLGTVYAVNVAGPFEIASAKIRRLGTKAEPVPMPFFSDRDPQPANYRLIGELRYGGRTYARARVVADDCVLSLKLDGAPIDLSGYTPAEICDWQNGIALDLGRYVQPGPHAFEAIFRNQGGDFAFRVGGDPVSLFRFWRIAQTLLAMAIGVMGVALVFPGLRRRLIWINGTLIALGAMLRLDFICTLHPPEQHAFSDAANYLGAAREIAHGVFGLQQVFQGVGYPVLLAWALKLGQGGYGPIHAIHWAASTATLLLVWRGTRRLLGEQAASWALLLAAFHFPFISMTGFFLAETVYTLAIAALFYLLSRASVPWSVPKGLLLGAVFMAGHALKGLNAFFAPLLFVWAAARAWRSSRGSMAATARALLRPLGGFVAGVVIVAAVEGAFTHATWGQVVLSAPAGGLNFVEGKCPAKINGDTTGATWQSPLFNQLGENQTKIWPRPFADQAFFWRAGLDCVRENPLVLVTSLQYVYYLFADNQLWPSNQTYPRLTRWSGMVMTGILLPGILIGMLVLLRHPLHRSRLPFLLAAAILVGSWALKAELRYRVPFDVVFLPLAVLGWSWILPRLNVKSRRNRPARPPSGVTLET